MSKIGRQFIPYTPFGPYICKSKISSELLQILLNTANKIRSSKELKKENDYRKRLAGNLREEYSYENAFSKNAEKIVEEELVWLASIYTTQMKKIRNKDVSLHVDDINILKPLWVNFMKSGEWNPAHNHTGDISCVMFLQVPPEIRKENKTTETSSNSNTPTAGMLEFIWGNQGDYSASGFIVTPEVGDIYLFPAYLSHHVYPFTSKVERISVSANFANKIKAKQNLMGQGEQII